MTTISQMSLSLFLKSFFKMLIKQKIGRINANKEIIVNNINPISGVTNSILKFVINTH